MNTVQKTSEDFSDLEILVGKAESHRDTHSITQIQKYVETHPSLFQIADSFIGELRDKILNYLASGSAAKRVKLAKDIEALKAHLAGNHQTNILDRILVEEIVVGYLFQRFMDAILVRHVHEINGTDIRRANFASTRLVRSIKALDKLRRAFPDIQLSLNQIHFSDKDGHN